MRSVEIISLGDELGFGDGENDFGEDGEAEVLRQFLEGAPGGAAAFDGEADVCARLEERDGVGEGEVVGDVVADESHGDDEVVGFELREAGLEEEVGAMEAAVAAGGVGEREHAGGEIDAVERGGEAAGVEGLAEGAGAAAEIDALGVLGEVREEGGGGSGGGTASHDGGVVFGTEAIEGGLDGGGGAVGGAPNGVFQWRFQGGDANVSDARDRFPDFLRGGADAVGDFLGAGAGV
jgi:hypothetical protein